ncbi:MAG: transglycosylase SLT domain-containing protein [Acidobacteriota bacterium]|nr:transglycosylase SLT domain-containing protein [Acidobacteriota bacterium]
MKLLKMLLLVLALILSLIISSPQISAQATPSDKVYQQLTQDERTAFVAEQARRIAREISGGEYEFTPAFEKDIQQSVNQYARRIANGRGDRLWKGDARFILERGKVQAPTLITIFKAHNLSPLIGLYIPWIESEYVNIQTPNSVGALGMFQFLPKTGERFGLSPQDLLDVGKSAAAAARYITDNLDQFKDDPMKEALALLAYNRGEQKTARDLKVLINEQNKRCSICALTADRSKLDETFQSENVFYVPRFFAAAIIGENPQAFGMQMQPLSAH